MTAPSRRPRTRAAVHAANLMVTLVVLAVGYFTVVGIIATAISQGWSA